MTMANTSLGTKIEVLVLEDDAELRFLLAGSLRHAGFTVAEAATMSSALAHLRTPANNVSLAFADMKAATLAFVQVMQSEFPAVNIILTSDHRMRAAIPEGMVFMPKPYILARVIAEIRAVLKLESAEP